MLASLKTAQFPEAEQFWIMNRQIELRCEALSMDTELAGEQQLMSNSLGTLLSLLLQYSRGYCGKAKGEQGFRHLAGLACKSGVAAFRLLQSGYYAEAQQATRNVAEIGNLMHLFYVDPEQIAQWLDMPLASRQQIYSPAGVRRTLRTLGAQVPTTQAQYAWLAETSQQEAMHAIPRDCDVAGREAPGASFSRQEMDQALAALAWASCTVAGPLAKLADLDPEVSDRMFEATIHLAAKL